MCGTALLSVFPWHFQRRFTQDAGHPTGQGVKASSCQRRRPCDCSMLTGSRVHGVALAGWSSFAMSFFDAVVVSLEYTGLDPKKIYVRCNCRP